MSYVSKAKSKPAFHWVINPSPPGLYAQTANQKAESGELPAIHVNCLMHKRTDRSDRCDFYSPLWPSRHENSRPSSTIGATNVQLYMA
jgi:hypothetical protein